MAAFPPVVGLVTLGVADVTASTAFYEALGFPLSSASVPGEVSFFRTAGGLLGLYGKLGEDVGQPVARGFSGVTLAVNVADRDAVDAAVAAWAAAGGEVVKTAQATDWGGYHAYVADTDGHLWEIAHNPFWPLDADRVPVLPE